jgi:hypothetical protein
MPIEYKAYEIGPDDRIVLRVDLLCENDDEAKERARQMVEGHAIELWQGATLQARFEPF